MTSQSIITYQNIWNMFAAGASAAPVGPSQQQVVLESEVESEAPAAMVVQEQEIGGGDSRCVLTWHAVNCTINNVNCLLTLLDIITISA